MLDRDGLGRLRRRGRGAVAERLAAELLTTMGRHPAGEVGSVGHDAGRIDVAVHAVVVPLDVVEVDRVAEARRLEQVTGARLTINR